MISSSKLQSGKEARKTLSLKKKKKKDREGGGEGRKEQGRRQPFLSGRSATHWSPGHQLDAVGRVRGLCRIQVCPAVLHPSQLGLLVFKPLKALIQKLPALEACLSGPSPFPATLRLHMY